MKHVLCFGDSNTWGFIPGTCKRYDEHTRWTGVLQDELGADWRIHENGQNGRTTVFPEPGKDFMTGLGALPYALDTLRPLDAIIIMLGTNDLKEHTAQTSVNGVGTRFARFRRSTSCTPRACRCSGITSRGFWY